MLPVWLKIAYSAFVVVLVRAYLRQYGAGNFLWFSDVALLLGCVALWLEHPLLASMQAIAVVVIESLWIVEFAVRLTTGARLTGLTGYMFDASISKFVRALSLFHVWLPIVLVWMVWRLGYDGRAFMYQTLLGSTVLVASFFLTSPRENVNLVHRWGRFRGASALACTLLTSPLVLFLPAHLVFSYVMPSIPR